MNLKQKVLSFLENNRGESVSGGKIATELGVTRSAVWKAIKSLQDEGYSIEAVTNKGYCLSKENDILSVESIKPYIEKLENKLDIIVLKTVDSTNNYAKTLAQQGAKEGTIIISEEQTAGKGRLGRKFYSPASSGICMSIIVRPKMSIQKSLMITTATAVIVSKAIEKISYLSTEIKWVNDIYAQGKKLCGILTEASIDCETGGLEYAIVGIGINVSTVKDSFPDDIKDIATSIYPHQQVRPIRSALIGEILTQFFNELESFGEGVHMSEYRQRSMLIGEEINVISADKITPAHVIDIDDDAKLIVRYENGEISELSSGEVSVRKK